jgi:hypothetical protein
MNGSKWCDFDSYLSLSDNRYHVRLGFLGLAQALPDGTIATTGDSPSRAESMDGGAQEWRKYPKFPDEVGLTAKKSVLNNLDSQPLADQLSRMYAIGVRRGDTLRRYSFWTGDDTDDVPGPTAPKHRLLSVISPESPQFALDRLHQPRQYVSLLLGGDENLWANVDFAGAFASCVIGRPLIPHVTRGATIKTRRVEFPEIAQKMRTGLAATVISGTAASPFRTSGATQFLRSLDGVTAYAKTGTLAESGDKPTMSRIVVCLIRWNGDKVEKGLVFSLAVERGRVGLAAEWLGEFLAEHADVLRPFL